jgi:hypothetical protein
MNSDAPIGLAALSLSITAIAFTYLIPNVSENLVDAPQANCMLLDDQSFKLVMAMSDCAEHLYQLISDPNWCFESNQNRVFENDIEGNMTLTYSRFISAGGEKDCEGR